MIGLLTRVDQVEGPLSTKTVFIAIFFLLHTFLSVRGQELDLNDVDRSLRLDNRHVLGGIFNTLQYKDLGDIEVILLKTLEEDDFHIYKKHDDEFAYYKSINLEINGPDGTRTKPNFVHLINLDTILVGGGQNVMSLYDSNGKKFDEFRIEIGDSLSINGSPFLLGSQAYDINGKVYCNTSGASFEYNVDMTGVVIDYRAKTVSWIVNNREEFMGSGYWGSENSELYTFLTVNNDNEWVVVSLPHYEKIRIYDLLGKFKFEKSAASSKIRRQPFLSRKKGKKRILFEKAHDAKYGFYYDINYNPFEKVYYRIAFTPIGRYKEGADLYKNQYVILLDDQFQKLGETKLPEKYKKYFRLITPDGLCLFNQEQYMITEDYFQFDCFKVKK